jgi:sugar O-acyltransferase (sialic acid O-acetyltransferase NeuD family)
MDNPVLIFGVNPIGRAAKEIFENNGNVVYGFLDDDKKLHNKEIDEVTVLGSTDDDGFLKLIGKKCEAFVATDDVKMKKTLTEMLLSVRHVQPVNAIHKDGSFAMHAEIGHGNLIDGGARISANAKIGSHCIIHSNAVIGVGTVLGDFVQVGAGSVIGSGVVIEEGAFIGAGVTIVADITIGKQARVGAGSVVIGTVKSNETVFGNPAQAIGSAGFKV